MGAFEFVALASLRVGQLMRGCVPRVDSGEHTPIVVAQMEVSAGAVMNDQSPARPLSEERQEGHSPSVGEPEHHVPEVPPAS
jgi:hypothetical protein